MDRTPLSRAPHERDHHARRRQRLIQYLAIGISVAIVGSILGRGLAISGVLDTANAGDQGRATDADRRDRVVSSLRAALGLPQTRGRTAQAPAVAVPTADPAATENAAAAAGDEPAASAPPVATGEQDATPALAALQPRLAPSAAASQPAAEAQVGEPAAAPPPSEPVAPAAPETATPAPPAAQAPSHHEPAPQHGAERSTAARLLAPLSDDAPDPVPARAGRPQRVLIEARIVERGAAITARRAAVEQHGDRREGAPGQREDDKHADVPPAGGHQPAPPSARASELVAVLDDARPRRGDGLASQHSNDRKDGEKGAKGRGKGKEKD